MNCLTIDFDIIMAPSIGLYNDLISDDWTLGKIEKEYPNLSLVLPPDYYLYEYITKYLIHVFKYTSPEKVFFIQSHETAAKILEELTNIQLVNIDHHHDIGYDIQAYDNILKPNSGNWVKYLADKDLLYKYTWIHNPNSILPKPELSRTYLDAHYELQQVDLFNQEVQLDKIILCNSSEWIPDPYQHLWKIWLSLAEEWYGQEFEVI